MIWETIRENWEIMMILLFFPKNGIDEYPKTTKILEDFSGTDKYLKVGIRSGKFFTCKVIEVEKCALNEYTIEYRNFWRTERRIIREDQVLWVAL